jgi:hypothetical protein
VTLTKAKSREKNWDHIDESKTTRYVIGDSRKLPSTYPDSSDAVPLTDDCPVQLTRNVWEDKKLTLINGQFGIFRGMSNPTEGTEIEIKRDGKRKACKYTAIGRQKMRGHAIVQVGDTFHEIKPFKTTCPIVDKNGTIKMKSTTIFPLEPAYWTRLHRLQGQTISGRIHVDFSGISSFDPSAIYVGLSRGRRFQDQSVENLDSSVFNTLIKNAKAKI